MRKLRSQPNPFPESKDVIYNLDDEDIIIDFTDDGVVCEDNSENNDINLNDAKPLPTKIKLDEDFIKFYFESNFKFNPFKCFLLADGLCDVNKNIIKFNDYETIKKLMEIDRKELKKHLSENDHFFYEFVKTVEYIIGTYRCVHKGLRAVGKCDLKDPTITNTKIMDFTIDRLNSCKYFEIFTFAFRLEELSNKKGYYKKINYDNKSEIVKTWIYYNLDSFFKFYKIVNRNHHYYVNNIKNIKCLDDALLNHNIWYSIESVYIYGIRCSNILDDLLNVFFSIDYTRIYHLNICKKLSKKLEEL